MCLSATALWVANDGTASGLTAFPTLNGELSGIDEAFEDALGAVATPSPGIGAEMVGDATGLLLDGEAAELAGGFAAGEDAFELSASCRRSRKSVSRRPLESSS